LGVVSAGGSPGLAALVDGVNGLAAGVQARTPGAGRGARLKYQGGGYGLEAMGRRRGGGQVVLPPLWATGAGGRCVVTPGLVYLHRQNNGEDAFKFVMEPEVDGVRLSEGAVLSFPESGNGWVLLRMELDFEMEGEVGEEVYLSAELTAAEVVYQGGEIPVSAVNGGGGGAVLWTRLARVVEGRVLPRSQGHVLLTAQPEGVGATYPLVNATFFGRAERFLTGDFNEVVRDSEIMELEDEGV